MGIINARSNEWRSLKVGNRLTLTDEPACLLANDGKGPFPIISNIREILTLTEPNRLAEWRLLSLDVPPLADAYGHPVFVLAKLVGDNVKVMLLRDSPFWKQAKRSELVNHASSSDDNLFLFSPPADIEGFLAASAQSRIQRVQALSFAGFFERNAVAGDGQEWKYVQRNDREFHCSMAFSPIRSGEQMATISEYGSDTAGVGDPELVILETGSKTNGTIRILTGAEISCDTIFVK
jgi:hypothetical protein